MKRCSLNRVKLTALYKHLNSYDKNTLLTYISTNRTLKIVVYHYCIIPLYYYTKSHSTTHGQPDRAQQCYFAGTPAFLGLHRYKKYL